jgi:putative FmdB family regulatory protein
LHPNCSKNGRIDMPTYDYKCLDCGYTFEHFQKISDEHLTNCPKCNGNVKRLIGAGSIPIFKGSGFYQTDYKNKPKKGDSSSSSKKSD